MEKHKINHYLANEGDHRKMRMVERFNRTVKGLISKYNTVYKTNQWIDALPDLIQNHNSTVHYSSTGYAPSKVGIIEMALIRFDRTHHRKQNAWTKRRT
jgi:hypothetical protein